MVIGEDLEFAVGRQISIQPIRTSGLKMYRQVHNAILLLTRKSPVHDFLIHSVCSIAESINETPAPQTMGPKLLTALHNIVRFPVIESVGMASPLILSDIADGGGPALERLNQENTAPLGAINLCLSYRGRTIDGVVCDDTLFRKCIDALENSPCI